MNIRFPRQLLIVVVALALVAGAVFATQRFQGRRIGASLLEPTAEDSDGDGLTDVAELRLGTDPHNPDTNGNEISDGIELLVGRSPSSLLANESSVSAIAAETPGAVTMSDGRVILKDFRALNEATSLRVTDDDQDQTNTARLQGAAFAPGRLIVKLKASAIPKPRPGMSTLDAAAATEQALSSIVGAVVPVKDVSPVFGQSLSSGESPLPSALSISTSIDEPSPSLQDEMASNQGLSRIFTVNVVTSSEQDISTLANAVRQRPGVEYAEPDYVATTNQFVDDPFFSTSNSFGQGYDDLWGLKAVRAPDVWATTAGRGVTVAVVDSGVDISHPDLAANIWTNPGETGTDALGHDKASNGTDDDNNGYIDDVHGWDFVRNAPASIDENGHGTHVAGTIAAVDNNGIGVIGVAPKSKIMVVRGLDAQGSGYMSSLASAIRYAADNGAKVINMSWGALLPASDAQSAVLRDALSYARDLGAVSIAAAGNDALDASQMTPANLGLSVVVGADTQTSQRADFSNFGNTVDVSAPGGGVSPIRSNILSTMPDESTIARERPTMKVAEGYWRLAGTSMATPHVSGVTALLLAARPQLQDVPAQTFSKVRALLRASSTPLTTDRYLGQGRVNAQGALTLTGSIPIAHIALNEKQVLGGIVDIHGEASGEDFSSYSLKLGGPIEYWGEIPSSWTTIKESLSAVPSGGTLASGVDLTSMDNNLFYILKLEVTTSAGIKTVDWRTIGVLNYKLSRPFNNDVVRLGDPIPVKGTIRGPFTRYRIEYGQGWQPTAWTSDGVTIEGDGTQSAEDALLGTWDTSILSQGGYFTLRLVVERQGKDDVELLARLLYLDPNIKPGWPKKFDLGMEYTWSFRTQVVDLNGDGMKEIVEVGPANTLPLNNYVYQQPMIRVFASDGRLLWDRMVSDGESTIPITMYPAIADLNGDGKKELVIEEQGRCWEVANKSCRIFAFQADGSELPGWPKFMSSSSYGSWFRKVAADVDHDGKDEVLFLSIGGSMSVPISWKDGVPEFGTSLSLMDNDGNVRPVAYIPQCQSNHQKYPDFGVGDVDGDHYLEALVPYGRNCDQIGAYKLDGTLVPGWPATLPGISYASIAAADLNGDHKDEVLVYSNNVLFLPPYKPPADDQLGGWLNIFKGDGTPLDGWPKKVNTTDWIYGHQSPAIGDVDDDGGLEIALPPYMADGRCSLTLVHSDGTAVAGWPVTTPTPEPCDDMFGFFPLSMSMGDVNGDGKPDVVFAGAGTNYFAVKYGEIDKAGGIWAWSGNGNIIDLNGSLPGFALMTESPGARSAMAKSREPPIIDDIDNDGLAEIILATDGDGDKIRGYKMLNSIFVWDLNVPYKPQTMLWPMFQHDSKLSGRYTPPPTCGNGIIEQGETCDDGNTAVSDGCSSSCTIEQTFACRIRTRGPFSVDSPQSVCWGCPADTTGEQSRSIARTPRQIEDVSFDPVGSTHLFEGEGLRFVTISNASGFSHGAAFREALSSGKAILGYEFSSRDAAIERSKAGTDASFLERFPGTFFASDDVTSPAIDAFKAAHPDVTLHPLSEATFHRNARYVFVADPGTTIRVRGVQCSR